jgi:O-glycosyl hydrolase
VGSAAAHPASPDRGGATRDKVRGPRSDGGRFTTAPTAAGTSALRIAVNTSRNGHTMEGFGGCFNEKGWEALAVLSEAGRAEVLTAMFGREGLRWGINRMPVGSSDFADSYYR